MPLPLMHVSSKSVIILKIKGLLNLRKLFYSITLLLLEFLRCFQMHQEIVNQPFQEKVTLQYYSFTSEVSISAMENACQWAQIIKSIITLCIIHYSKH